MKKLFLFFVTIMVAAMSEMFATPPTGYYVYVLPDGTWEKNVSNALVNIFKFDVNDKLLAPSIDPIQLPKNASSPNFIAATPDQKRCFITDGMNNAVYVFRVGLNVLATTLSGSGYNFNNPVAVCLTNEKAYVLNNNWPSKVSVIDITNDHYTLLTTIDVGENSNDIKINADYSRIYVVNSGHANQTDGSISVIDTTTDSVIKTIPITYGNYPYTLAINPTLPRAYVTNYQTVSVINLEDNTEIASIAVSKSCSPVVNNDGSLLYVARETQIAKINTSNYAVTSTNNSYQRDILNIALDNFNNSVYFSSNMMYYPSYYIPANFPIQTFAWIPRLSLPFSLGYGYKGGKSTYLYCPNNTQPGVLYTAMGFYPGGIQARFIQAKLNDNKYTNTVYALSSPIIYWIVNAARASANSDMEANLQVKKTKSTFLTQSILFNTITWDNVPLLSPVVYRLYRQIDHVDMITEISANNESYKYVDNQRIQGQTYYYYLTCVNNEDEEINLGYVMSP